jgi:hypothetical protein
MVKWIICAFKVSFLKKTQIEYTLHPVKRREGSIISLYGSSYSNAGTLILSSTSSFKYITPSIQKKRVILLPKK